MTTDKQSILRRLPAVEHLLIHPTLIEQSGDLPHSVVADSVREAVESIRDAILTPELSKSKSAIGSDIDLKITEQELEQLVLDDLARRLDRARRPHFRRVINAAGIVLHTALGRAVLAPSALEQISNELSGYSLLQVDLKSGKRSQRDWRIEQLLQKLTGCEAATIVNNNAAATALVLNTVAGDGQEVIVSRGQLVEIGGAFRLPDVMAFSGAKMVEVGTTNKTHLRDYENAITEHTAAILRVHPSNFKIEGFTSEVALKPMVQLAHKHNIPLIDDVGAGSLIDFSQFGFGREPTLPESIRDGADLVTSSADKLIGGPQGGIILGRKDLIQRVRKNQFARIVRACKLTYGALEATLTAFLDEQHALGEVPTLVMLRRTVEQINRVAVEIAETVRDQVQPDAAIVEVVDGYSQMGSGSLPTQNLPSRLVAINPIRIGLDELALRLRMNEPPILARIRDGRLLLDPRTLLGDDARLLADAVVLAFSE